MFYLFLFEHQQHNKLSFISYFFSFNPKNMSWNKVVSLWKYASFRVYRKHISLKNLKPCIFPYCNRNKLSLLSLLKPTARSPEILVSETLRAVIWLHNRNSLIIWWESSNFPYFGTWIIVFVYETHPIVVHEHS